MEQSDKSRVECDCRRCDERLWIGSVQRVGSIAPEVNGLIAHDIEKLANRKALTIGVMLDSQVG